MALFYGNAVAKSDRLLVVLEVTTYLPPGTQAQQWLYVKF